MDPDTARHVAGSWAGSRPDSWPASRPGSPPTPKSVHALTAYMVVAMLLGGAGDSYALITALVEIGGLALLAYAGWTRGPARLAAPGLAPNLMLLAILVVPLLQLIPLPYGLWAQLPGRALANEILGVAGLAGEARPASLNPHATFAAWLTLFPAVAIFLLASRLPPAQQRRLIGVAIGAALLSALLGAVQKASGGAGPAVFFPSAHSPNGPGLFVDRNHQATFLLMAMPLAAGFARAAGERSAAPLRLAALGLIAVFAAAVVATTSRMGMMGLPLAALAAILILFPTRLSPVRVAIPILGLALAAAAVLQSSGARLVLARFASHDVRFDYWADAWIGVKQYFPWGAGFGSFEDIYPSLENLNIVSQAIVYNAHNDYIELLLDGGIAAAVLILAFLLLITWLAIRALRAKLPSGVGAMKAAACTGIVLVLFCSFFEYPLRMYAIQMLFALLCAILVGGAARDGGAGGGARKRGGHVRGPMALRLMIVLACAGLGATAAVEGVAGHLLLIGRSAEAKTLTPGDWRTSFAEALAAAERRDMEAVKRHALDSLKAAPMRSEPATMIAMAAQDAGQSVQAARMITAVAPLGWRHGPAQMWMFESALAQGNAGSAVLRADALLRQGLAIDSLVPRLRGIAGDPRAAGMLAERLAADPPWREAYLVPLGHLKPEAFAGHLTLLHGLRGSETPPRPEEIAAFSARLIAERHYEDAQRLWKALAPAPSAMIDTGSPFDWSSGRLPGLEVMPAEAGPAGVSLNVEGSVAGVALDRLMLLAPGRYILRSEMSPGDAGRELRWRIVCEGGQANLAIGVPRTSAQSEGAVSEIDFAVPAGCGAVRVALWIDHAMPAAQSFVVRNIAVRRQ